MFKMNRRSNVEVHSLPTWNEKFANALPVFSASESAYAYL